MALNDLYEVRAKYRFLNEEMENVFYYRVGSGAGAAEDLANEFKDVVWDAARAIMATPADTYEYRIINIDDDSDFSYEGASSPGGWAGGLMLPPFIGLRFRSPSAGPGSRYSYHIFSGMTTSNLSGTNEAIISESYLEGVVRDLSIAMGATLEGAEGTYVPVQVHKAKVEGNWIYTFNRVLTGQWVVNRKYASQRTRMQYSWILPPAP